MSLRDRIENPPPFRTLALWRRVVLICGLVFMLAVGAMSADKELDIYGGAPNQPVAATGQICEVHVMHGSVRYVTPKEREALVFWERHLGAWVGLGPLAFIFLWLLYRPRGPWPLSQ
jgi:hypothetical protein